MTWSCVHPLFIRLPKRAEIGAMSLIRWNIIFLFLARLMVVAAHRNSGLPLDGKPCMVGSF